MITNEQIIDILTNWEVKRASIISYGPDVKVPEITFIDLNKTIEFNFTIDPVDKCITVRVIRVYNDPTEYSTHLYTQEIPNEISTECLYFMTTKAKEWVQNQIKKAFTLSYKPTLFDE